MADDIKGGAPWKGGYTVSAYGVWARDGNNFVSINGVRNDGALTGITPYRFTPSRNLIVVQAQEGCSSSITGCSRGMSPALDDPTRVLDESMPRWSGSPN